MPALSTVQCGKQKGLMSALGQKQTSAHVSVMSALPPKADIAQPIGMSASGHKQTLCGAAIDRSYWGMHC